MNNQQFLLLLASIWLAPMPNPWMTNAIIAALCLIAMLIFTWSEKE